MSWIVCEKARQMVPGWVGVNDPTRTVDHLRWYSPGPCTMKQIQHAQDKFLLSCFTKPNNRNRAKQYDDSGYQLLNSNQVSPTEWWVCSHKKGLVCKIWPITNMDKSRALYFTQEEQTWILNNCKDFKSIIQANSNTVAASKKRKECWEKIANSVNA